MEGLHIRPATVSDLQGVLTLIAQPDMSPDTDLTTEEAQELFEEIHATGCHTIYVAELNSELVATFALIVIQQLSHNAARSMIIEDIVVGATFQGQGIGKRLMHYAVERARSLGCYKLCLSSGVARSGAHEFYQQLGFEKDGFRFKLDLPE